MALDPLTAVLDIGGKIIDKLWPNPVERDAAKLKLFELHQSGELAVLAAETELAKSQIVTNQEEAKNTSLFVAGWRPAVGWTCGMSLLYVSVLEPLLRFVSTMAGYTGSYPVIDTELTLQVLLGMLGLAGMRSFDKAKSK